MKTTISIIISVCCGLSVAAQSAPDVFDAALSSMVTSNPDLKALRIENDAAISGMKAENVLEGLELEVAPKWGKNGNKKIEAGISQSFDWPGLYRARKNETDATRRALDMLSLSNVVDKTLEARQILLDIISVKRNIAIFKEIVASMNKLNDKFSLGFKRGEVSIIDLNKIQIESLRAKHRLFEEETRLGDLIANAESFAGNTNLLPLLNPLTDYPEQPVLSEEIYENNIMQFDPQVAHHKALADAASKRAKVARLSALPSFSLGYGFAREEEQNFHGFTFGMKFATWSNSSARQSARLSVLESTTLANSAQLRSIIAMRNDLSTARELSSQVDAFSSILNNGNQTTLLLKAFEGGEMNLLTYLQELNYFVEAKLDYEEVRHELASTVARLNRLSVVVNQ